MQVLKKVDWKMFVARSFLAVCAIGLTAGVWCFVVAGMALHSCAKEPELYCERADEALRRWKDRRIWRSRYGSGNTSQ